MRGCQESHPGHDPSRDSVDGPSRRRCAAQPGVADLLVLLQARNNAVADMRRLNDRLKETSDELASRNQELERELEHRGRLEEQLLQSQKMEAIGQLASGVAHDFNNVLLAVSGHATLGLNADRVEDAIRHFESIIEAGDRAADITARLLVFARRNPQMLARNIPLGQLAVCMQLGNIRIW